ncbi:ribosomal protein S18 [Rhizodiscina lignyota]|uniref:Small ribosomal subunit protein bS18m n=1 Tax=Rhizodiscina lignyota TaxID=1504668 RepID=A0A9P4II69_9PEZI|nr:ribosomal protein S18 [Rhizodiscina lignyota]
MNSSKLVLKLLARRQQCCRAFSSSSLLNAQSKSATAALWALQDDTTSRPQQVSTQSSILKEAAQARIALARQLVPATRQTNEPLTGKSIVEQQRRGDMEKLLTTRRYRDGDIVSPHDLSFQETLKWRMDPRKRPQYDVFDMLGIDPRKEYKNFALMSEFMTDMGRIKHSSVTGLRAKNQRRIAKAIRRAIGLGLMPSVHRHPELLEKELRYQDDRAFATKNQFSR